MNDEKFSYEYQQLKNEIKIAFVDTRCKLTNDSFDNGTRFMQLARKLSNLTSEHKFEKLAHEEKTYINYLISEYYEDLLNDLKRMVINEIHEKINSI